ncbi:DNA polymerase I [Paucidesulfovibrio longus]|uniref:DNA polymerase I n=1 Tax=Paucidesulfovibrio longus TaxID=889 RepID=UPI0003B6C21A|nr:DNA polymerase I [Paucidesulfovibrio longus]
MSIKERFTESAEPLYLVDGTSFLYRGFYAYPDLKRSDGFPTNAIFIVLRILLRILRDEKPKYLGFFMDGKGPTFRHEMFDQYKAQRPRMPEDLAAQIEPLREAVQLMGLHLIVSEGVEADDCIASLAARHKHERPVVIVGSDKDLKQCIDTRVVLWDPAGKSEKLTTLEDFTKETGLTPAQWPDFQALTGDTSDNIPGIPGVGPKTAEKIMAEAANLEELRDGGLERLPEKLRAKVAEHLENTFLYRELTRMRTDCCEDAALDQLQVRPLEASGLGEFLRTYEFRSLLNELFSMLPKDAEAAAASGKPAAPKGRQTGKSEAQAQASLFGAAPIPAPSGPPLEPGLLEAPADLPDCAGKTIGLVVRDKGIRIAVQESGGPGEEQKYTGPLPELVESLAKAATVATPDVQSLLRAAPAWEALPLEKWFDLGLAAYLLDPEERNYSWERLHQSIFQPDPDQPDAPEPANLHPDAHAQAALVCMERLAPRLKNANLDELMREMELPLLPVLTGMERAGIRLDQQAFGDFLDEVQGEIENLTSEIHKLADEDFNIRSSQQVAGVLFDKLGLKPAGKTPGGAPSTANQVLEKIRDTHPIVEALLQFRMLEKLRSTYLEPLPKLVDENGRLHTHFNLSATATGRLSSSGPNLQNIPIRGPQGKRMRACFTAAPGKLLAAADYSQIELRVLAHFSKDPALLNAFAHDEDIHSRTAALLFDKDSPQAVTSEERRSAKTINFGLIYGMGPQRLARELKVTLNDAKGFIERYFERLSTLKAFYDTIVEDAAAHGFVTTLAGRRRLLPGLHSRNQQVESQAKRQAVNTVIQGSAADVIKLAMLAASRDQALQDLDAVLLLQVHDELLLEAPEAAAGKAGERLAEVMQNVVELRVPLKVDMGIGLNWAEAH